MQETAKLNVCNVVGLWVFGTTREETHKRALLLSRWCVSRCCNGKEHSGQSRYSPGGKWTAFTSRSPESALVAHPQQLNGDQIEKVFLYFEYCSAECEARNEFRALWNGASAPLKLNVAANCSKSCQPITPRKTNDFNANVNFGRRKLIGDAESNIFPTKLSSRFWPFNFLQC